MNDVVKKVKEEPLEEFEDALRTLASAAVGHDSLMASHKPQMRQEAQSPDVSQQQRNSAQQQMAVKREPITTDRSAALPPLLNGSHSPSRLQQPPPKPVPAPAQWFDVGFVRKPSCAVHDFYFTETAVDHSADTSDEVPDYRGLQKLPLLPGVAYKFRVAAVNSCGIGEWSEASAFKTCVPGYPGAPGTIRVAKSSDGVSLRWEAPLLRYGNIVEYSVCLGVKSEQELGGHRDSADNKNGASSASNAGNAAAPSNRELHFLRVYCGSANCAFVENSSLRVAHVDQTAKPAIIFRIAARNEKGYGPATQVRWLQDFEEARNGSSEAKKRPYSQVDPM